MNNLAKISKPEAEKAGGKVLQLVSFRVGDEEFGMDILKVQEIVRMQSMARVPNAPAFLEGIINLRGKVIPVVGLRQRIGLEPRQPDRQSRTVIAEVNGAVVGFAVDSVSKVLRVPVETVEPPPDFGNSTGKEKRTYISGIGKLDDRLLLIVDTDRLLDETERKACLENSVL